ncbi:MAG: glucose 1-dehydrogenase [Rhizonema sp. PD38]|nr:glucose 1-dehydrogenase [Rhizonema sp. PD38]
MFYARRRQSLPGEAYPLGCSFALCLISVENGFDFSRRNSPPYFVEEGELRRFVKKLRRSELYEDTTGNLITVREEEAVDMTTKLFALTDKVAIVTGAGRGLGKILAKGLAEFGAKVVVCDRILDNANQIAQEINTTGIAASTYVDISLHSTCQDLIEFAVKEFGRVDVLVNNAGFDIIKLSENLAEDEWDKIIDVNLKGCFNCSQLAALQMMKQGTSGSIINISSIASVVGIKGLVAYSAAKGGINQLTRVMAVEWAEKNIRVNAIAPGFLENIMQGAEAEHAQSDKQTQIATFTPMARRGRLEEIVGPVIFLASDASSYVTGTVLFVDGGYTAA